MVLALLFQEVVPMWMRARPSFLRTAPRALALWTQRCGIQPNGLQVAAGTSNVLMQKVLQLQEPQPAGGRTRLSTSLVCLSSGDCYSTLVE